MDREENASEVEKCREDGFHSHVGVGGIHILRHKEGGRTHNGGHNLPAGRGSGLHRRSELTLVAGSLHHGDGDGAGGNGVAHGGTGHHAAEGGRDDRYLGGAAGGAARQGVGQINKEIGDTRPLQERAEDDEHGDKLGAHLHRGGQDAGGAVEEGVNHPSQVLAAGKGVDQQHPYYAEDRKPHAPAAKFRQAQDAHNAQNHIEPGAVNGALRTGIDFGGAGDHLHQGRVIDAVVEERTRPQEHQNDIIPGHGVGTHMVLPGGVGQIAHDGDEAQEGRQPDRQIRRAE